MKNKKQVLSTMVESLLLGVLIVFGNKIPNGTTALYLYGWWKLILGIFMVILIFVVGITLLIEKEDK